MESCTRMMNHIGIICIFLAFSVESNTSLQGFNCVSDYWVTINCSFKLDTSSRNISYRLELCSTDQDIAKNRAPYSCQLQRKRENHTCSFTVDGPYIPMRSIDIYNVTLHYSGNISVLDDDFRPSKNIKTKAPFNLTLQYKNGMYCFFWKNGYENHTYGTSLTIMYNFLYYKDGDQDSKVSVHQDNKTIQMDEMKLDPDTSYTAMVRTGIQKSVDHKGTWSDWSSAVKWKTAYRDDSSQVGKIVIGTILVLGILILLISIPAARIKMKEMSWVPTPVTYFQPLYQNYQGNFQFWVMAKSPLQDIHVIEDFSTIDKISEVITTLQDQVEKTGMYPEAQCHQPYVGPTAEVWAPRQMPDTCSETSIPCEEFSLFCEELPEVDDLMQSLSVACLSGDVLSLKESALSLESLEDCEPSEAPVIINPMCLKQGYCTLTDTPTGPVPTFTRDTELDENNFSD